VGNVHCGWSDAADWGQVLCCALRTGQMISDLVELYDQKWVVEGAVPVAVLMMHSQRDDQAPPKAYSRMCRPDGHKLGHAATLGM
jgi:hypothetical protein